jgi:hypothetical protein
MKTLFQIRGGKKLLGLSVSGSLLVLLHGFQKGRDIKLEEKGREQFWPKKGQFASYKEKLE